LLALKSIKGTMMSETPIRKMLESTPNAIRVVDFEMSVNESNIQYAERICQEFGDPLPESRFGNEGTIDGTTVKITGPEMLHLIYNVACAMTGRY
jgi:hypothetical protein